MATSGIEVSDLRKLTVVKLRERLSSIGLTTSGLKADLVERLHGYYKQQAAAEAEEEEQEHGFDAGDGGHGAPPQSLMSLNVQEPPQRHAAPPPPAQAQQQVSPGKQPVTRTSLQMRLQQMAGQSDDPASAATQPTPQAPAPAHSAPPPPTLLSHPPHQTQAPPPAPQMSHGPPPPTQMSQQPPGPPPSSQQMGQVPPPPQSVLPPPQLGPPQLGQPPQQMVHPGPPPMSQPPPPQMGGPPPPLGQPPQLGQPGPPGMPQPPPPGLTQPQGPLPPQMSHPPPPGMSVQQTAPQMSQPPPPALAQQPPPQMTQAPPPQQISQPTPPAPMSQPPPLGPPHSQMGPPPHTAQPPPLMSGPPPQQDPELQEKIAMQNRIMEQERADQRLREQQQAERQAIQQQAMMLQQQQQQPEQGEEGGDLMEKVRQQQIMLEQLKHKERMEHQQQQDDDRRRRDDERMRQQQRAMMEAKHDEQQNRRGPPQSSNASFNPQPGMLHGSGPRPLLSGSSASGIPPLLPPHSSSGGIPPLLPRGDRGPRHDDRGPRHDDRHDREPKELKLPSALEKVLAFKDVRAQEVGMTAEEVEELHMPVKQVESESDDEIEMVEMEEEDQEDEQPPPPATTGKESKNKKRKKKKKKSKKNRQQQPEPMPVEDSSEPDVQIEYVQEQLDLDPTDPNYFTFSKIFEAFKITDESAREAPKAVEQEPEKAPAAKAKVRDPDDDDDSDEDMDEKVEDDTPKLSKKKLKKLTRLSVAQLKQLVTRPDVVEMHDVTAQDPRLLVHLKATRNSVPVPRHWCFKRKYLQGKRGIEKAPFELPEYIQATGITEMRAALAEKEDAKNLKSKMREKVRPKMGKIDIDYQKLHDAFFRWQVKPKMTIHGDLYYEGKEFETRLKEKKPGNLSDDLKTALGMPIGPQSEKVPPPWLIAMQRYGPPPSYPNLKIPGLNGPIPDGCSFGYHAGGWGKPPVDEIGKPLYGDVFGTKSSDFEAAIKEDDIDHARWGELESESESEEESESESEEEGPDDTGLITPAEGLVTPSGITSVPVGMETPDMIELRKRRIEDTMDQGGETPALYQVIPEKKTTVGGAMMGSAHIYDVPALPAGAKKPAEKVSTEGIEVALNPEELDLDTAAMQAKYDQTLKEQQSQLEKEDLSDMVAEHAAKQKKRKKKQEDSGKAAKKYKEFKF